jgi:hypothetical protein
MSWSESNTTGDLSPWVRNFLLGSNGDNGLLSRIDALTSTTAPDYDTSAAQNIASVQNRIAGFNPLQRQAFQDVANMQVNPFLQQGAGMTGMAGMGTYNMPTAQNYMNPYTQMVTNQQKQGAIQDYRRNLPALQATGYQQGAGRGTRNALLQSEANRNLQTKLGDIEAKGLSDAWTQGMGQYNAEQNRMLTAGTNLGNIGNSIYDQQMGINKMQQGVGATMQGHEQTMLDTAYENYLAKQREPYQQLSFMLDALAGTPQGSSSSYYYAPSQRPDLAAWKANLLTSGIGSLGKISGG